jgi:hypothetical protein
MEPVTELKYLDVRNVAEKLKGIEGNSDNISNACGNVLMRISGLMELADFVFCNLSDFEE